TPRAPPRARGAPREPRRSRRSYRALPRDRTRGRRGRDLRDRRLARIIHEVLAKSRETDAKRSHAAPQGRGVLSVRRRPEERRTTFAAKGSDDLRGIVMNNPG